MHGAWGDGDVTSEFLEGFRFSLDEKGVLASVVHCGDPVNVFDTSLPFFSRLLGEKEIRVLDVPSFAVFPLRRGASPCGVLYADREERDEPFSDEEAEALGSLADLLSLGLSGRTAPAAGEQQRR